MQALLVGDLAVRFLVEQATNERFGHVGWISTALYLGVDVLDADQLADALDDAVTNETVTAWHLLRVDFREVVLFVEVVEQRSILVQAKVKQILRRHLFGLGDGGRRRARAAQRVAENAFAVAGDDETAYYFLFAQLGLVRHH